MTGLTYTVDLTLDPGADLSGNELGTSQTLAVTANATASPVEVLELAVTFVAGTRPVFATLQAYLTNDVATGETRARLLIDGAPCGWVSESPTVAGRWARKSLEVRLGTFTPGSSHTVQVLLQRMSGNTARLAGDSAPTENAPASLTVFTR